MTLLPLSEKLKSLREENGLSQEELAIKLNVVRQTVSKWEKGLSTPDAETLVLLAAVFDTSVGALLDEEQIKPLEEPTVQEPACEPSPKRRLSAISIVLLIVGSVVWVPLGLAAIAVALAIYIVIWAAVISLWAAFASLGGCSVGGVIAGVVLAFNGSSLQGLALIGAGLVCAGLAILTFFGCKAVTKCVLWLTKKAVLCLKSRCAKKEAVK